MVEGPAWCLGWAAVGTGQPSGAGKAVWARPGRVARKVEEIATVGAGDAARAIGRPRPKPPVELAVSACGWFGLPVVRAR